MKRFLKAFLARVTVAMIGLTLTICLGCGPKPTPGVKKGYIEYIGPTFTLQVPTQWKQTSNPQFQALFLAPEERGFSANLGVTVDLTAEEATVEMIAEAARKYQYQDYPQYFIISEQSLTVDGKPAFKRVYTWHSAEHDLDITQVQLFVKDGVTLYILTATSLKKDYDRYKNIFREMMDSFQLTE